MALVVTVIAVACVGLLSRRYTLSNFHEYVTSGEETGLVRFGSALAEYHRQRGGWGGVQPLLDEVGKATGRQVVLIDGRRQVLATSPPELMRADVRVSPEHTLTWAREERRGREVLLEKMVLDEVPHADLYDPHGRALGALYVAPMLPQVNGRREDVFVGALDRTLLLAGLVSACVALLAALALSRRILGPVEALTGAARRMEGGDLSQRVKASSRDEIGELARAFNAMADNLARAEQLRRNMIGDVAHELRTPLTNIRCQIEAVQDGIVSLTPAAIDSLHEEAMLLNRLIDDLQDLALAEAGQLSLKLRRVSVMAEVASAVSAMQHRVNDGGPTIRTQVPDDCPDVFADPERVGQILRNLLANAITHTPPGGEITVRAHPVKSQLELAVEDTGSGIAPEDAPFIFERFYRADASRQRGTGGAGLGLAIIKQLVAAQAGEMRVESLIGKGTKISFTLPIYDPLASAKAGN
ncbi:MAG: sensor histidine kinase [Pyrinomonadaceae bacterium]